MLLQMGEPYVTIVGFGSLLSKRSALTTTPSLRNYQYVRVKGYQRIFQHPAAIFFERGPSPGIALPETKEISSLSTRPNPDSSFVAAAYEIPKAAWAELAEREEEFAFVDAEFEPLVSHCLPPCPFLLTARVSQEDGATAFAGGNVGVMCTMSTDEKLRTTSIWPRYVKHLSPHYGETSVWGWGVDSGILPCRVYTRHCVLAVHKEGVPAYVLDSFLDDTFLGDRVTPLRLHLESNPGLMETEPPEEFKERYSG